MRATDGHRAAAAGRPAAPGAGGATSGQAEAQALDLAKKAIALRSVRGPGNETPAGRRALQGGPGRRRLCADGDVTITPVDDTAYLIARWPRHRSRRSSRW